MMEQHAVIYRAGVIPYYVEDGVINMLFMVPSNEAFGGSDPQLPKGRIDEGEDAKQAALREGNEEVGLLPWNIEHLEEVGTFLGRTTVFVAKVKDKNDFGDFHFETKETTWMTPEQFDQDGRLLHQPVVRSCVRKIKQLEQLQ